MFLAHKEHFCLDDPKQNKEGDTEKLNPCCVDAFWPYKDFGVNAISSQQRLWVRKTHERRENQAVSERSILFLMLENQNTIVKILSRNCLHGLMKFSVGLVGSFGGMQLFFAQCEEWREPRFAHKLTFRIIYQPNQTESWKIAFFIGTAL